MGQPIDTATILLVSDSSEFARQLRTQIDEAMRMAAARIEAAFSSIEADAARAGHEIGREFQQGGEVADAAFRETASTAKREFAEVAAAASAASDTSSGRLTNALDMVGSKLKMVGVAAVAGLGAISLFGLKSAANIEQVTIGLTALTGSAQTAQVFLKQLQDFAAATPFEFAGVAASAKQILAFGQAVGITREQVIPTLTTIGDLVSELGGTQQSIDSVILAMGQIASKGKADLQDIYQISGALPGFSATAAIAAATGKTTAQVMTEISAGTLDANTAIHSLLTGMAQFKGAAGAMAMQSQTLLGVFSTFKDTVGIALSNAFQPVIPQIKSTLTDITPVIGDALGKLAPALGGILSALLPLIGKLITAIVPILTPLLNALGPALDALGPALVPLGEALGQLVVALVPVLPIIAQFIVVLAELAIPIIKLLAAVLTPLTPVLNYMALAIGEVARALGMIDWTAVGHAIGGAFSDAWHAVADFFTKVFQGWLLFHDMVLDKIAEFKDNVVAGFNLVVKFVQDLPGKILTAAGNFLGTLVQAGVDLVTGLWNGISGMGSWLWGKITSFISENIVGPVKDALGIHSPSQLFADEVGEMIPAGIAQGAQAGAGDLRTVLAGIVPTAGAGQGAGAGAMSFAGGINVTINFVGGTPTLAEARIVGVAAGDGIMQAIARRNVATAVRMGVSGVTG